MKIVVNFAEIKATLNFIKEMDPAATFSDEDIFDSIEKFTKAMDEYNSESEGLVKVETKLFMAQMDENGKLIRDSFTPDDEFIVEIDSDLYKKYAAFLGGKLKPFVALFKAIVDLCESFATDAASFFDSIMSERKLARLEKENAELKASKAEIDASEKEAQDQLDEADKAGNEEESVEDFIARCEIEVKTAKKEALKPKPKKSWGEL